MGRSVGRRPDTKRAYVKLAPGEKKKVRFTLTTDDLAFYSGRDRWETEPGEFTVFVGTSSADVVEERFVLTAAGTS